DASSETLDRRLILSGSWQVVGIPVWLVAGGSAVITDHEARDIHGFEVRQGQTGEARKIVVVPASVGCANQAAAVTVIGQDDSVVTECGDDNGCLWTGRGAGRSRDRSLQAIDLTSGSGHGAGFRRRRLRNFRFHSNGTACRIRATSHACCFRSRPN